MQDNKNKSLFRTDLRTPMIVCSVIGVFLLGMLTLLVYLSHTEWISADNLSIYAISLLVIGVISTAVILTAYLLRYRRVETANNIAESMTTEISDLFRYVVDLPYAIINAQGQVKIVSNALQEILKYRSPVCNVPLTDFCSVSIQDIMKIAYSDEPVKPVTEESVSEYGVPKITQHSNITDIHGRKYQLRCFVLHSRGVDYFFVIFDDITEKLAVEKEKNDEDSVVAYAIIDSLQELAQYARAYYQDAVESIENLLKEWVADMGGFIREYEREKYLLVFNRASLDRCISEPFSILEKVRNVKVGDNPYPVTISVGVGSSQGNMEEKEREARDALDIALQKGGDQVVVKSGIHISVYGGRTNTTVAASSIAARDNAQYLCKLISEASNVLIMGHRFPDFDSIGSCVGLARIALEVLGEEEARRRLRIVVDRESPNFQRCYEILKDIPEYHYLFVGGLVGLDSVRKDSLLIISDVSNMKNTEEPKIVECVKNVVIVDHHRRPDQQYDFQPKITYILPGVAAASELVSGMLEFGTYHESLRKEEATLLLAGLMLDTKNFTSGTEIQTFGAAQYLCERGANIGMARSMFKETAEEMFVPEYVKENLMFYRDKVAIAYWNLDHPKSQINDIIVSKAADSLMKLERVEAAFVLLHDSNNMVKISARSYDKINVQLILQELGGGGHFDMAAAVLTDTTIPATLNLLKKSIDRYLEHGYDSDGNGWN